MTESQIIFELNNIISYCEVTKEAAQKLKRSLKSKEPKEKPGLSKESIEKVLKNRRNFLMRKNLKYAASN